MYTIEVVLNIYGQYIILVHSPSRSSSPASSWITINRSSSLASLGASARCSGAGSLSTSSMRAGSAGIAKEAPDTVHTYKRTC